MPLTLSQVTKFSENWEGSRQVTSDVILRIVSPKCEIRSTYKYSLKWRHNWGLHSKTKLSVFISQDWSKICQFLINTTKDILEMKTCTLSNSKRNLIFSKQKSHFFWLLSIQLWWKWELHMHKRLEHSKKLQQYSNWKKRKKQEKE